MEKSELIQQLKEYYRGLMVMRAKRAVMLFSKPKHLTLTYYVKPIPKSWNRLDKHSLVLRVIDSICPENLILSVEAAIVKISDQKFVVTDDLVLTLRHWFNHYCYDLESYVCNLQTILKEIDNVATN